jgi:hypothetical protein
MAAINKDFMNLKGLVSNLYNFMNMHVFSYDRNYFKYIEQYEDLSDFFKVTLILSENPHLRSESSKKMKDML